MICPLAPQSLKTNNFTKQKWIPNNPNLVWYRKNNGAAAELMMNIVPTKWSTAEKPGRNLCAKISALLIKKPLWQHCDRLLNYLDELLRKIFLRKLKTCFNHSLNTYPVLHLRYPLAVQSDLITFDKGPFI